MERLRALLVTQVQELAELQKNYRECVLSHQDANLKIENFEKVFCDTHLDALPANCPECRSLEKDAILTTQAQELARLEAENLRLKQHLILTSDVTKSPQDVYEVVRRDELAELREEKAMLDLFNKCNLVYEYTIAGGNGNWHKVHRVTHYGLLSEQRAMQPWHETICAAMRATGEKP